MSVILKIAKLKSGKKKKKNNKLTKEIFKTIQVPVSYNTWHVS